jgi:LacI family transcriptional regulator
MPTIQDVAVTAGVSTATVSRALSGRRPVAPKIRERVQAAARQLDYLPNGGAKNLRRRATSVWGLVLSDIENNFFTSVVRGIEEGARAAGYSVILCNTDGDPRREAEYLELLIEERIAGVVIATASSELCDVSPLRKRNIPVVAMDRQLRAADVDTVVVDNRGGARAATRELLDTGARQVGCITGPEDASTAVERLEGYRLALAAAGVEFDPELVRFANFRQRGGYDAACQLLDRWHVPDALFVTNDLMTVGALEALSDRGLAVPDAVALASFDDLYWTTLVRPRLTAVAQPTYELGRTAADLLAERIRGYQGPARLRTLETILHVRDSSRRPP